MLEPIVLAMIVGVDLFFLRDVLMEMTLAVACHSLLLGSTGTVVLVPDEREL